MVKYTYAQMDKQRSKLMRQHYRGHLTPLGIDANSIIFVFPAGKWKGGGTLLSADRVDTFMNSSSFDKDLFETLTLVLEIRADTALMMCLS